MPHQLLGKALRDAAFGELGGEGVPQGVEIDLAVQSVKFLDVRRLQVLIEVRIRIPRDLKHGIACRLARNAKAKLFEQS